MTNFDQPEPPVLSVHNGFEVYPMPMFATLETADVDAVAGWYEAALGFRVMFKMPTVAAPFILVHLRRHKYQDVLVRRVNPGTDMAEVSGWSLGFQAEDVDQLAAHAASVPAIGRVRVEPVVDTPWNTRQVRIVDPDGRSLVFSQPRFVPQLTEKMRRGFEASRIAGS